MQLLAEKVSKLLIARSWETSQEGSLLSPWLFILPLIKDAVGETTLGYAALLSSVPRHPIPAGLGQGAWWSPVSLLAPKNNLLCRLRTLVIAIPQQQNIPQIKLKLNVQLFQWQWKSHSYFACCYQLSPSFLRLLHLPRKKHKDFGLVWFYSTIYFFCFSLRFPFPCLGHTFSKQAHIYLYIQ